MTAKELGQQAAFPSEQTVYEPGHTFTLRDKMPTSGLTKREQFAMAAMQGRLAGLDICHSTSTNQLQRIAETSCAAADALLEELAKGMP